MKNHIFLIAGEASGDNLGSRLMLEIKNIEGNDVFFSGIGGEKMQEEGLSSIFPMSELSLLGFVELLPHIPHLLKRIEQTVDAIISLKPDIVVTIDAPAFNNRVIKKLKEKESNIEIPLIHYVAPTVWAYKPHRAEKISKLYDHLLCLLPFEPPYFEKENLPTTFIGHPITECNSLDYNDNFLIDKGFSKDCPTLSIMIGSRKGEIKRLFPIFTKTIKLLKKKYDNLQTIIISTDRFHNELEKLSKNWSTKNIVVSEKHEKYTAIKFSDVALAKSGTGSIEISLNNTPIVIAYKVNPISAMMLKRMIQVDFVNLINIILNREVIPECLQKECNPDFIANRLFDLFDNEENRKIQLEQVEKALIKLGKGQKIPPSQKATELVLSLMNTAKN